MIVPGHALPGRERQDRGAHIRPLHHPIVAGDLQPHAARAFLHVAPPRSFLFDQRSMDQRAVAPAAALTFDRINPVRPLGDDAARRKPRA